MTKFFSALVAFSMAAGASASITLDATSTQVGVAGATSLNWNHALGSGGSRMVVCGVTFGYNDTAQNTPLAPAPSMTFNGVAMTASVQAPTHAQSSTSKIFSQLFYVTDTALGVPAAGTYPVVLTIPTAVTGGVSAGCTSVFGAAQQAPETTASSYSGSSTPVPSATLTTVTANDWVIDAYGGGYGSSGAGVPNTGQTQLYNVQSATGSLTTAGSKGGVVAGGSYEQVAMPGSVTVGWNSPGTAPARTAYAVAAFAPASTGNYTVTTAVSPAGAGTIALSPTGGSYASGTSVQVTANPAVGYAFTNFSGDLTGSTNPQTLTVNGNKSLTANFVASLCTLTTNTNGSGTVTLSPAATNNAYTCGTQVQVTAVAASGYSFGQFSGALTGSTNPQTLTLNNNASVTATFVQGTSCTLSTSVTSGSGTIGVSPAGTVFSCGTQITVMATPAQYYSLTGFSGAITGTTNPQTYTLNANSTIGAAFAQTTYPINTTIVGPGTVTASPADSGNGYAPGTTVQLTATPNSGSFFTGFSGDLTGTTNPQSLTVNATRNVTATFSAATITQDAVSHGVSKGTASTISWTHTLGAGSNRAIVIAVGQTDTLASPDSSSVVQSVLFNGIYATPVPNSTEYGGTSGSVQTQLFYLLDSELPAAGTYTITVNLAGSVAGVQAGAVSFFGVQQGGPDAVAINRDTAGADLISTSITTMTNNDVIVDALEDNNVTALTANSGQTVVWSASASSGTGGSSTKTLATAGTTTLGWSGTASRLSHSLAAFAPATATPPPTYTLTTSVTGGTGGTITTNPGLSQYPQATGVLLTATPQTGYSFSGWTGDYTSSANPLPITMDTNRNVVANFATAATCTLAINIVGQGTVTPAAGTYNCGTVIHFVATAASGYTFTSYSGDFSSMSNPADFNLTANSAVTVEFDPVAMCTLNITPKGSGTVTPANGSYTCGSVLTLQATAASGYGFAGFSGDFSSTANPASLQLTQSTNITANFTAGTPCTLTTSYTGQGSITPKSGSWACGTAITIEADAATNYAFNGWGGDLSGTMADPATLTLNANKNVTAAFVVNTAGVTGDSRTVTQPVYPAVCSTLTAVQTTGSLVETSPDTTRVQNALNACAVGQAVEFASNGSADAFILQPITLPAGVTMLVDPEVTIYGSIKSTDYPCSSASFCTPLIDVAANNAPAPGSGIMGLGVIDGRGGTPLTDKGKSWWGTGSDARPRLVYLSNNGTTAPSDNFTMYQITLKNSPKFEFSGIGNNLTIWDVKVIAPPDSPNTDGIDPSSSSNITITNSFVSTGDDMIAMKAGNGHISNVTISNNHMYSGHGITVGSETNAGLNNMLVINDAIDNGFGGSSVDSLRIKSDTSRGGEVHDVLYKNICINHGGDSIVIDPYYSSASGSLIPNFHDITFSNIHKLIHDSSHKSTFTGYNTSGTIYPLTVTLDSFYFDGDTQNDFAAPSQVNNAQFTLGPGPVSIASFLTADAAVSSNYVTVTNSISNSNPALDCSAAFIYLAGDLTAHASTVAAGSSPVVISVLQNVVSPLVAGTISYPQQNKPTGSVQLLEGSTVVATGTINGRLVNLTVPSITVGKHTYTAKYLGDGNFSALSFGSFVLTATSNTPVANSQTVTVPYNTATAVTLTGSGPGTLTYTVLTQPAHGALSGTAPNLTYTPTTGYSGSDSFTFKVNNGTDSNTATVTLTVQAAATLQSQTISFPQPATPTTVGSTATLAATSTSGLAVSYTLVSGPATLSGTNNAMVTYTGAGSVVLQANQAGNATYAAATPVQRTVNVTLNTATVTVVNQSIAAGTATATLSAMVSYTASTAPTGAFTFQVDSGTTVTATCTGTSTPATCTATYTTSALAAGPHNITGSLAADAVYGAASNTGTLTVGTAATAVTVSAASIAYGTATTTLSASVSYTASTAPSGAFTFQVDSGATVTATCSGTTSPRTCTASYTTATLAGGSHTITAALAADANYTATSGTNTLTVTAAAPTVTASAATVSYGTATTTLSATVAYNGTTPTGALTFQVDSGATVTATCTGTSSPRTCTATYTTSTLTGGSHTITAALAADTNYSTASGTNTLTVTTAAPSVTVSPATVAYGAATTTLSATVSYSSATAPTGAFTFQVDSGATVTATCSGTSSPRTCTASYATSTLAGGAHTITGTLAADTNYATASGTNTLTVTTATPVVNASATTISYGTASTTLSATVTYGGAVPTGAFTFQVDSGATVSATCSGTSSPRTCTASYATSTLTGGTHTITAALAADANYGAASGTNTLTVTSSSASTVTVSAATIAYGTATTTLSATVGYSSATAPTGAFTFQVDSGATVTAACTGTTSPRTCTASYATGALTGGSHTITATLAADPNYTTVSGTNTLTVTMTSPVVTVSSATVGYGTPSTTLSATVAYNGAIPAGAFTFQVDGGTIVTATCSGTNSPRTCTASYATSTLAGGSHTITGTLAADANYATASSTNTLTVTTSAPGVSVASQSIAAGAATATLSATVSYSGAAPTGALTFQVDSGTVVTASCTGSASPRTCTASYPTSTLTGGSHTITATLAADANYAAASGTNTLTVVSATAPGVNLSAATISYGTASTTLSAMITYSGTAPSGAFSFQVDSGATVAATCTGTASPRTCTATYATGTLAGGSHTITGTLAADANYSATSGTNTLTVSTVSPSVTVASQSITAGTATASLTATVSYSGAVPKGAFTFIVDSGATVTAACNGASSPETCTATYTTSTLTGGKHTITGSLAADPNYSAASGTGTLTVTSVAPAVAVSAATITYGTSTTTLSATVTYAASTAPTGTFTFQVDAGSTVTATCTGANSPRTCTATYATSALTGGAHTITGSLAADATYSAASSTNTLTVTSATPSVAVSNQSVAFGTATTTLTASVTYTGSAAPTGALSFKVDAGSSVAASCTGTASSLTCTASYATGSLSAGAHTISASLAADGNYTTATGTGTLTITGAAAPGITVNAASITYGTSPTMLSAKVAYTGTTAPTGAVTFKVDAGTVVTATCTGTASPLTCSASYPTATLTVGNHAIAVSMAADANYSAASGTGTLAVSQAATTTTLSVSSNSTTPGTAVTLTATVVSSTTGTPTGSVIFYDGTTAIGTVQLANGSAVYSTTTLAAGTTHSLTAVYMGDTNFMSSTSTASAGTTVVVSSLDFTFTLSGSSTQTVNAGSTATYQFMLAPQGGLYPGAVNFSVTGLPSGYTATFYPVTAAAGSGAQPVTLTITTTKTAGLELLHVHTLAPMAWALLLLPLWSLRKRKSLVRLMGVFVLGFGGLAASSMLTGCGSNSVPAPSTHTYSMTVTATSGTLQHPNGITLIVQ